MKKRDSIYLESDREAAERLKNLVTSLKKILALMSGSQPVLMRQLHVVCPALQAIIKGKGVRKDVLNLCGNLRDAIVGANPDRKEVLRLMKTLYERAEEDLKYKAAKRIKVHCDNIGMTERYRPLTERIGREKVRKLGNKGIKLTDMRNDPKSDVKLVRRIVEKRAAQEVHKNRKKNQSHTNSFRQQVRRASSFSLYSTMFTAYDNGKRAFGTHWSVDYIPGKNYRRLRAKKGFGSYEEAWAACESYTLAHPEDTKAVAPYICSECGRWHFGHDKYLAPYDWREVI